MDQNLLNINILLDRAVANFQMARFSEAEMHARKILEKSPNHPDANNLLGMIALGKGCYDLARTHIENAIKNDPNNPTYYYNLGCASSKGGHLVKALEAYQKAIKLNPRFVEALHNSGFVLLAIGRLDEALQACNRAIQINPNDSKLHNFRGNVLARLGRFEDAIASFDRSIEISPRLAETHNDRGSVLRGMGHLDDALASFDRSIQLNPGLAEAYSNRAVVLHHMGHLAEALKACEQSIRINPNIAASYITYGNALKDVGYVKEAEHSFRKALELKPDDTLAHSNLLFLLAANARLPPDEMLHEQRRWNTVHSQNDLKYAFPLRVVENVPERRLRVGYVSPDLRKHAVSYFFEPLLAAHDRKKLEIFCYDTNSKGEDETTLRLRGHAEHWRNVVDKNDVEMARLIYNDGIDILVDLAGHTAGNRLKVFAYKPAPVQATYLGFFASTGLDAMDYWITDNVLHPVDTAEQAVECIYRLPRTSFCYLAPHDAPAVSPCPCKDENVTFGSFCHVSKLSLKVIETWSQLLRMLPGSRLQLMDRHLRDSMTRQLIMDRFSHFGVKSEQIFMSEGVTFNDYLAAYANVDIVLDTFPRTGGTTTAEALWMGVPVITLMGQRYVERISSSKLIAIGLEELIAHDQNEYMNKAVSLANNPGKREKLRTNLREWMAQSPLCDANSLAREFEAAYRFMWEQYLSGCVH